MRCSTTARRTPFGLVTNRVGLAQELPVGVDIDQMAMNHDLVGLGNATVGVENVS